MSAPQAVIASEEQVAADEFYPELVCMLINFINRHENMLATGSPDHLEQFGSIANNSLFHISKESGVQFILEEAGWFAGNRDSLLSREFFQTLKYNLTALYWEQLEQCMPPQPESVAVVNVNDIDGGLVPSFNDGLEVEDHPDLFEDHVATYSYLPNILLNSLLDDSRRGVAAEETTRSLNFEGVCMLADISGFTKLTGRCCEEGTSGLDALHDACSGYLGKFVQTVYTYKGDVISFAGDALIVIFPLDPADYSPDCVESFKPLADEDPAVGGADEEARMKNILKARCCQRAVICGKILASFFTDELTAHVGISYGPMSIAKLGGFENHWVYLMNGACINEISTAVDDASSKQVCVTKTVFDNLFTGLEPAGQGQGADKVYRVQTDGLGSQIEINATATENGNYRINSFVPRKSAQAGAIAVSPGSAIVQLVSRFARYSAPEYYAGASDTVSRQKAVKTGKFNESVKLFVPKPVLDAISFSTLETVSELREVTTMFMKLDSYDTEKNRDPQTLQEFCYMAQEVLAQTGGFLRQFLIDDKGCVLIAMWGVPSFSFSNNSARAVAAGVLIYDGTHRLGHKCSIGITAGTVFVGNIGSLVRRDFVAMGADVNLAARFMGKSKGRIFIDEKTANNLPADFRAAMPLSDGLVLKGVKDLTYAHICDGDVNAHVTIEFLKGIKSAPGAVADTTSAATGGHNAMTLLSKAISEPIKNRIQKTQRRHQFVTRGKGGKTTAGKGRGPSSSSLLDILPGHREVTEHHKPHPVNFIVAEGMAGTGKTTTTNFFKFFALKCHVNVASVTCLASDTSTPLGVVRKLALQIIGEEEAKNPVILGKLAEHMHWDVHFGQTELSDTAKVALLKRLLGLTKAVAASERCARHNYSDEEEEDDNEEEKELNQPVRLGMRMKGDSQSKYSMRNVMGYFSTKVAPEIRGKASSPSAAAPTSTFEEIKNTLSRKVSGAPPPDEDAEADAELPEHSDDEGIFFHMFFVLLNHSLYALVVDDAHHCDESSWNVIYMMSHLLANSIVFLSLRSLHARTEPHESGRKTFLQKVAEKKNSVLSVLDSTPSPSPVAAVSSATRRSGKGGFSDAAMSGGNKPPTGSSKGGIHDVSSPVASKDQFAWSKAHHVPQACVLLMKNPYCIHLALNPFTLDEVRHYMQKALNTKNLPEELIESVFQVSTGSPYWCKQIASFISERGQELFITTTEVPASAMSRENSKTSLPGTSEPNTVTETANAPSKTKVNPLHVLIICRLESMSVEQQAVIKHASIIGEAFHAALLDRILPQALKAHLIDTIAVLVNNCLLFSEDEDGDTYKFGNHLIHQIIYDLTPPSESSKLHKLIGDCIEDSHNRNLDDTQDVVVYYQLLIYHYALCPSSRAKAFKYLVKACDECVARRAYEDVAKFASRAKELASSRTELKILQSVVQGGSDEAHAKRESRKMFTITSSQRVDNSEKVLHLLEDVLGQIEDKIEELNATRGVGAGGDIQSAIAAAAHSPASEKGGVAGFDSAVVASPQRPGASAASLSPMAAGGDGAQRHTSIAMQRQKSRQLDWEGEVRHHLSQDQVEAEQRVASQVKNLCTIM